MYNYETFFYCKQDKKSIVYDYLKHDIPKITAFKIIKQMMLLQEHGLKYGYVKYKKFQNEMFKIRLNDGNNNCRVYFIILEKKIYFLYAYNKKTQKTHENIKVKINNLKTDLINDLKQNKKIDKTDLEKLLLEFS